MITLSRALLLLLLLLQILNLVDRCQGRNVIGRSDHVRGGLTWPDWWRAKDEAYRTRVRFELFTRENPDEPELVDVYGDKTPSLQHFKPSRRTKVLTHGWLSDGQGVIALRQAFLSAMDVNVVAVNWTDIDTIFYPVARCHVPLVGQRIAYLLDFLHDVYAVPMSELHLIGHSLGAHISGMAGRQVKGGLVGRITGLDPAGPLFPEDPSKRLDKTDAQFVDVIHTCANVLGYKHDIGHVDFYPNGGTCFQPGCKLVDLTHGTCSHDRAYDFMEESIRRRNSFQAFPCKGIHGSPEFTAPRSSVTMGLDVPDTATGTFCLTTASKSPFALSEAQQLHGMLHTSSSNEVSDELDDGEDQDPTAKRILRAFMRRGNRLQQTRPKPPPLISSNTVQKIKPF